MPVSDTDITDIKGNAQVKDKDGNLYNINVSTDEKGAIEGAEVKAIDGIIAVILPDGTVISYKGRTTVTVSDRDNIPVVDMSVNVTDNQGGNRTENTDKNGAVVVPPRNEYETNDEGNTGDITVPVPTPEPTETPNPDETAAPEVTPDPDATPTPEPTPTPKPITEMNVKVEDESGVIEGAIVTVGEDKEITVALPDGKVLDKDNRITVTVTDQDGEPVSDLPVTVNDKNGNSDTDTTNKAGIVIVPVTSEDNSDDKGGMIKDETAQYTVTVENTDGKITDAVITIADGKISVVLPDTHTLTTSNQTVVTVVDKDSEPVKGVSVTVIDKNSKTATQTTNADGKITVPVKTTSSGVSSGGSSGGGGGSSTVSATNVKVVDKDGKTVSVSKSTDKDGNITLTLPNGKVIDGTNYYVITVTDGRGNAKPDTNIILKDKNGNSADGVTDKSGKLTLPANEHKSYIVGYNDGTFKPEGNMTRAEAAAIFARNIADGKGETIKSAKSSFTDVAPDLWYSSYISYLEKYNIINGYDDKSFKPDAPITRAEFVKMCVNFCNLSAKAASSNKFTDVEKSHWAYSFINSATAMGWINGYADDSFKPDNNITRAEVVAIVNRATEREADTNYVNKNLTSLNRFSDLTDKGYWAYMDIIEAANTHNAVINADGETWVK